MQDKPIFESPHVLTGLAGLGLLSLQATLPAFFASQGQSARDVVRVWSSVLHSDGPLGSSILMNHDSRMTVLHITIMHTSVY